ncbi:SPJ_0845 family protein [Paucilactobacillus hokkaidonensis]|uniref:SPJ_0845 family protein n=1 Tax=Paucilactobacillus hokkaidonensis TaxID=1193095 RepID=UPI00209375CC|nr:SPJ_0845 family protein [Paucilactobacillus hokkaidonensis]
MGLIVRRELNLEKLFDDFAVDPKKRLLSNRIKNQQILKILNKKIILKSKFTSIGTH